MQKKGPSRANLIEISGKAWIKIQEILAAKKWPLLIYQ